MPSIRGRLTGILYGGQLFIPVLLLWGTMLQYPWQRASRSRCTPPRDERWHPRVALEISLWHPPPFKSGHGPLSQKTYALRRDMHPMQTTQWGGDPLPHTPRPHQPAAWMLSGPRTLCIGVKPRQNIRYHTLSEQVEQNKTPSTRWPIATADGLLTLANANMIALAWPLQPTSLTS